MKTRIYRNDYTGEYCLTISGGPTGSAESPPVSFKTKAEAKQAARMMKTAYSAGSRTRNKRLRHIKRKRIKLSSAK